MPKIVSVLILAGLVTIVAAPARAVDVTECGQIVPKRQIGQLVGDLDCTDPNSLSIHGNAVVLGRGATLELRGFSLIGPIADVTGVDCHHSCSVRGPGTISGFHVGIHSGARRIRVSDVTIEGSGEGVHADRLVAHRLTVTGTSKIGISGVKAEFGKIILFDSEVSGNVKHGIVAGRLVLKNVIVTENGGYGVWTGRSRRGKIVAIDSVISGNAIDCPPDDPVPCKDLTGSARKSLRRTLIGETCFRGCPRD